MWNYEHISNRYAMNFWIPSKKKKKDRFQEILEHKTVLFLIEASSTKIKPVIE